MNEIEERKREGGRERGKGQLLFIFALALAHANESSPYRRTDGQTDRRGDEGLIQIRIANSLLAWQSQKRLLLMEEKEEEDDVRCSSSSSISAMAAAAAAARAYTFILETDS